MQETIGKFTAMGSDGRRYRCICLQELVEYDDHEHGMARSLRGVKSLHFEDGTELLFVKERPLTMKTKDESLTLVAEDVPPAMLA